MLWKLPSFSEKTVGRYFEYLSGRPADNLRGMLNWIDEFLRKPRELVVRKISGGKEVEFWKKAPSREKGPCKNFERNFDRKT